MERMAAELPKVIAKSKQKSVVEVLPVREKVRLQYAIMLRKKAQKTKKKIALLAVMCCEQKKIARSSALI